MTDQPDSLSFKEVIRSSRFWRWLWAVSPARLPPLMAAVAVTTATTVYRNDPDSGGTVVSAYVIGLLVLAPFWARLVARKGVRRVVQGQLLASGSSWVLLSAFIVLGAPFWSWHLMAFLAGAVMAGSAGLLRATLKNAVGAPRVRVASTLDVTALDLSVFLAPLLVTAGLLLAPIGATLVVAVVSLLSILALRVLPKDIDVSPGRKVGRLALSLPLIAWGFVGFAIGFVLGMVEIGAVSFALRIGLAATDVWIIFALLTLTSIVGGVLDAITAAFGGSDYRPRVVLLTGLMVSGCVLVVTADSLWLALVGLALIGLPTGPLLSARSLRTEVVAPVQTQGQAFVLMFALQSVGFAVAGFLLAAVGQQGGVGVAALVLAAALVFVVIADRPVRLSSRAFSAQSANLVTSERGDEKSR